MNRSIVFSLLSVGLVLTLVVIVGAQPAPKDSEPAAHRRIITANGTGEIHTQPDSVRIYLGVITEGKTVAAAREENARTVKTVQAAIIDLKLPNLKAKTRDMSVTILRSRRGSNDDNDDDEKLTKIIGYRVSQEFSFVFQSNNPDELAEAASRIFDTGFQNGANERGNVNFFLSDSSELELQAKTKAVEDALANAKALADGAKLKIIEVVEIDDSGRGHGIGGFGGNMGGQQGGIGRRDLGSGFFAGDQTVSSSVRIVCRY